MRVSTMLVNAKITCNTTRTISTDTSCVNTQHKRWGQITSLA